MPANILNLPAYTVTGVHENDHDYHVDTVTKDTPSCPHCRSNNLVGFGRREQMIKDLPMHAKRVGIYIDTRRFKCMDCSNRSGKAVVFYEPLPEVDDKRLMTKRLVVWIGKQSIRRTFTSIAEEVGITEGTVRSIFRDYVNELERTIRFETPKWMGIDEIHLIRPRGVISNIQNNTIVELLPNRNKDTLVRYLHHLEGKNQIQYVAMDMWQPYRDACKAVIPDARIVIDKFHVLRMANDAMEHVRKSLRESLTAKERRGLMHDRFTLLKRERDLNDRERLLLSGWTRNYPELGLAHRLKEDFFGIYDAKSPDEAQGRYIGWKKAVTPEIADAFSDLIRAWENWAPHILTYFEHPVTNAYTESLNSLIRVMNRLGRGYSFEALRAKILFAEGAHRIVKPKPKFERRSREYFGRTVMYDMLSSPKSTQTVEAEKNYGVDISTLVRMIESGQI